MNLVTDSGLTSGLSKDLSRGCLFSAGSLLCLGLLILLITWNPHPVIFVSMAVLLVLGGIILFFFGGNMVQGYFRFKGYAKEFKKMTAPRIKEALDGGLVEVKQVVANSVIEIQEFEDEGPGYIFDIGDNKTLLLKGQRYFPAEESADWPNTDFEIVQTVKHSLWIGIFCRGKMLNPSLQVPSQDCDSEFIWDEREEIVAGTPTEVLQTIRCAR